MCTYGVPLYRLYSSERLPRPAEGAGVPHSAGGVWSPLLDVGVCEGHTVPGGPPATEHYIHHHLLCLPPWLAHRR